MGSWTIAQVDGQSETTTRSDMVDQYLQRLVGEVAAPPSGLDRALWVGLSSPIPLHPRVEDDRGRPLRTDQTVLAHPSLSGEWLLGEAQALSSAGDWESVRVASEPLQVALRADCIVTARILNVDVYVC